MNTQTVPLRVFRNALSALIILLGLYFASRYNYLLFHSLAETFSVLVALGIFMVAWNSIRFLDNNYLLFIGIAYLFVGMLDLIHSLGYQGMNIFRGYDANLSTQFWIAARSMESLSLLIAPLFLNRRPRINLTLLIYSLTTLFFILSIFWWDIFPVCFQEGSGLTLFKKVAEYCISLLLLASIVLLVKKRKDFDPQVLRLVVASISLTVVSELFFTFYVDLYGVSNLIGHYLKIISFYLIYKAIIETGFIKPYNLLFRNLKQSENSLNRAREDLEKRVHERTSELRRLSRQLINAQEEERRRIALELHDELGQSLSAIKFRIEKAIKGSDDGRSASLSAIVPMVQRTVNDVRRIQKNLRPPLLDDLGILATISWFCREFEETYKGIHIERRVQISEKSVPKLLKIVIYRILQEALNNAAKHSDADSISIVLRKTDGHLEMVIHDNGIGFDLEKVLSAPRFHKGIGLYSMKERAELSGGRFSILSGMGTGSRITATWHCSEL